ncbi:MAG: hypothetical protein BGP05_13420 [Rhizobiales bacterium 62-47]|nr:MAG: hypothetical protein BGP05_13420 [Rhizobiales bacterium 62-47]
MVGGSRGFAQLIAEHADMAGLHVRHEVITVRLANLFEGAPLPLLGAVIEDAVFAALEVLNAQVPEGAALDLARRARLGGVT